MSVFSTERQSGFSWVLFYSLSEEMQNSLLTGHKRNQKEEIAYYEHLGIKPMGNTSWNKISGQLSSRPENVGG